MFSRINPENQFSHHMPDVRHATARGNGKKNGIPHQVKTTDSGELLPYFDQFISKTLAATEQWYEMERGRAGSAPSRQ